jgi:hypothetical protein
MVIFLLKNPQNLVTLRHLLNKIPLNEPNWNFLFVSSEENSREKKKLWGAKLSPLQWTPWSL